MHFSENFWGHRTLALLSNRQSGWDYRTGLAPDWNRAFDQQQYREIRLMARFIPMQHSAISDYGEDHTTPWWCPYPLSIRVRGAGIYAQTSRMRTFALTKNGLPYFCNGLDRFKRPHVHSLDGEFLWANIRFELMERKKRAFQELKQGNHQTP